MPTQGGVGLKGKVHRHFSPQGVAFEGVFAVVVTDVGVDFGVQHGDVGISNSSNPYRNMPFISTSPIDNTSYIFSHIS